jgi:hypothetical protein
MNDFLLGDLYEEFAMMREERGPAKARLWYARQLLLSLPVLLKPAELLRPLSILLPLLLLDRLWCFVYSLIPLKDGLDRAPGFLAINILCACFCTLIARPAPVAAGCATACALVFAVSAEPAWYVSIALISVFVTARLRRLIEEVL